MPETNLQKFKSLLAELFMFDHAELDFGIYRIMNAKRGEITRFLDNDLLPQVRQTLAELQTGDRAALEAELKKTIEAAKAAGIDPKDSPKVRELEARYKEGPDLVALEHEVFSNLYDFFRRYYHEGDFLSLRRYKEGVYAIPYEGEEVKLHWANADQYYIKTSEYFRDYAFKLPNNKRVHFRIAAADTEKDNTKAANGKDRRFILCATDAVAEEAGELVIRFEYRPDDQKRKQDALNAEVARRILTAEGAEGAEKKVLKEWGPALATPAPTEANPGRTLLEKNLADYTARNTFDYFIHKDLGGFLRRELDFYIKNEVMHLDDIENESAPRVEQYLCKIKAIRRIAYKIIDFLAQLEDFQKKLWLKKKFVVETNYCITLDRVPEALYPEIAANDAQREEWVRLFAIDEIKGDLHTPGYSSPLQVKFLKANQYLMLDTRLYGASFRNRLLASLDDVEATCDGLLVHGDNFHALLLLRERYQRQVECIHIDPPYNTETSGFLYKNNYQHSSWLAMMESRVDASIGLLNDNGAYLCHIDENEYEVLSQLFEGMGIPNAGTIVWDKKNPMLGRKGIATQHEYVIWRTFAEGQVYRRNATLLAILEMAKQTVRKHRGVTATARHEFSKWIASCPGLTGGDRAYSQMDDDGRVYRGVAMGAPEPRSDPKFHIPLIHPVTKKPCPVPPYGWSRAPETLQELISKNEILFGPDERVQPNRKVYLTEDSRRQLSSVIQDTGRGKADVDKFGLEFPYCHPVSLYVELVGAGAPSGDGVVLDFFAGSGTTAHVVIDLNREDEGSRRYILVEMGEYFDTVLKPRIQKVVYSKEWKDGKPVSREGVSHMFKYIRLESYEDALNNLWMRRTAEQEGLLASQRGMREDYMLRYMLDVESRGSASLLNIDRFADPFSYKLKVAAGSVGETREVTVDLVETFNYLIGLRVKHVDAIRGFRVVQGTNPADEKVLVIWRNVKQNPNAALDDFFLKQKYNTRDMEFDLIYVNGDNNLENLKRPDDTWKVRLIEEEFLRLMFDVQDV